MPSLVCRHHHRPLLTFGGVNGAHRGGEQRKLVDGSRPLNYLTLL